MDIFERILKASELYDDNRPGLNDGGMLVKPSADGSRPGYASDRKDVIEKAQKRKEAREKGLVYDTATKTFRKKEGVTYLTTSQKNKIKEAFPNVKLNFNLYPNTGVKKYPKKGSYKTNKTYSAIERFKKKGYTLEDLRTGGSGKLPPIEKGKVSATELLEMINKYAGTTYTSGYLTDPRPGKKAFLQNIIADTLNRETRKQGTRTYNVFDKPTAAQLDFFADFIDAPFLYDKTVRNVKILDKEVGKLLAKSTKKDAVDFFTNELTIDKVKEILKNNNVKNPTNYKAALAMTRYGQALQGKLFKNLDGITKDNKTGDFIFEAFNGIDKYHPWSQGAYTAILNDIDSKMGKKAGNLSQFKNAFKAKMTTLYPDRKFDFNEVFSISTSANRGSYPYAYFVDLTSSAMNRGALSAYQGAASVAEGKIQTAIKNFRRTGNKKFYDEAVDVANIFNNQTRKKFLSSESVLQYQKDFGIKPNALKIQVGSQRQIKDKINIASNYFSDKNLQKWKNLGIDIDSHSGRAGYVKTFGGKGLPSNVVAAGELFTEDTRLGKAAKQFDENALNKFLKNNIAVLGGGDCARGLKAQGGRIGLQDGTPNVDFCFKKGIDRIRKGGVDFTRAEAMNFNKLTKGLRAMGASNIMKFGVLPEALFEGALIADKMVSEGDSAMQGVRSSYLSIPFQAMGAMKTYEEGRRDEILAAAPESQRGKVLDVMSMQDTLKKRNELAQDSIGLKKQIEATDKISDGSFGYVSDSQDLQKRLSDKRMNLQDLYRGDAARAERILTSSPLDLKIKDQLSMDAYNQAVEKADALRAANIKVSPGTGFGVDTQIKKRMQDEGILKTGDVNEYLQYMGDTYGTGYTPLSLGKLFSMFGIQNPRFGFDETGKYNQERGINDVLNYMRMQNIADAGGVANLAGGGIAGLSGGVDKGPAPESGPASDGLLKLFKRVRNY